MKNLKYSLVIESTEDPNYFGYYSPDLEGFSGSGNSVEDCLRDAQAAMIEHIHLLEKAGFAIPPSSQDPTVTIRKSKQVLPAA